MTCAKVPQREQLNKKQRRHFQEENKLLTLVCEKFFWIIRLHNGLLKQICGEDKN
jgi:hypothetical protein